MYNLFRQTYRHLVQQAIIRQEMRLMRPCLKHSIAWETGGIAVLFGAAAVCGLLAQANLGGSIL